MCKILDALHEYVPSVPVKTELTMDDGECIDHLDYSLIRQLLGGDYLTVARVYGAIGIRSNHEDAISALKGLIPVIEDWHTRMTIMQVSTYTCTVQPPLYLSISLFCSVFGFTSFIVFLHKTVAPYPTLKF